MSFSVWNLEYYLELFISDFPRLRTVHLWLTDGITMGKLISFRNLNQALSKQSIFSELVFKVKRLTLLEKSQLKEYQALGINRASIKRVLRIVKRQYDILIDVEWQGSKMMVFYLSGLGWELTVKVDLTKEDSYVNMI